MRGPVLIQVAGRGAIAFFFCVLAGCKSGPPGAIKADAGETAGLAALFASLEGPATGCAWSERRGGQPVGSGSAESLNVSPGPVLFDIGSVSKSFTAAVIIDLADTGQLSLEETAGDWLGTLPDWGGSVTLRDLLAMRSGVPEFRVDAAGADGWEGDYLSGTALTSADPVAVDEILQAISQMPALNAPPGSVYEYSNSNYILLRAVAEKAAGKPLAEQIRLTARSWARADVHSATFREGRRISPSSIAGHDLGPDGRAVAFDSHWDVLGASGVWMTMDGLALWGQAILEDPARLERLGGRETSRPGRGYLQTFYGLGLMQLELDGRRIVYHLGGTEGFSSGLFIDPEGEGVLSFSCNMSPDLLFARARSGRAAPAFEAWQGLAFLHVWLDQVPPDS